jgi:thioredoxin 1
MLNTNLKHIETEQEVKEVRGNNENVMICCGRMGPMCIPVFSVMNLPECALFMGLPFTVYFKNAKVVAATSSIQNKDQVMEILDREFGKQL